MKPYLKLDYKIVGHLTVGKQADRLVIHIPNKWRDKKLLNYGDTVLILKAEGDTDVK